MDPTVSKEPLARPLYVVLVSPQIPPNTGNIARLCACTGSKLLLVEPLGFSIDDKQLKRAGLDYWDKVFMKSFPSWAAYLEATVGARRWYFSALTGRTLWDVKFEEGDHLVFGAETTGLPEEVLKGPDGLPVTIPMLDDRRGLNLSTSAGIATYEALRQLWGAR